jgi:hypothetical protein
MKTLRRAVLVACVAVLAIPASTRAETTTTTPGGVTSSTVASALDPAADGTAIESWSLAPTGNRSNLSYTLDPGGTVKDQVVLANYGNVPLVFTVYATDAFNNAQGKVDALAADEKPIDVGLWVKFPQQKFSVPPRKQLTIPITITVPDAATFGDHSGALLASSPTISTGPNGSNVIVDRRTGTRLNIRVNGDLTAKLAISNLNTHYHHSINPFSGSADVAFRLSNLGNVRISGTDVVKIAGPLGLFGKKVTLDNVADLLPGQHIDIRTTISGVVASVLVRTEVVVTPKPVDGVGAVKSVSASNVVFAPPLTLLVLLIAALIVMLIRRAGRRRAAVMAAAA